MDHVRIDEGIKRGKRVKPRNDRHPVTKRFLPIAGTQAQALEHREQIIARLASGELLRDVAASLDVSPAAISQVLSKDPQYLAARESGIEQQLEQWQACIEHAQDPLNLARGREAFRAAAWRGEREFPHRWGAKQEVTVDVRVRVDDSVLEEGKSLISQYIEGQSMLIPEPAEDGVPSLTDPTLPPV